MQGNTPKDELYECKLCVLGFIYRENIDTNNKDQRISSKLHALLPDYEDL